MKIARTSSTPVAMSEMYRDLTSFFIRRAICGLTAKNYNNLFVHPVKRLEETGLTPESLRTELLPFEGDASRWPSDDEFQKSWMEAAMYPERLNTQETKWLLIQVDRGLRSLRSEEQLPLTLEILDIDHVLPSSWYEHWQLPNGSTATETEANAARLAAYSDQAPSARHSAILQREAAKTRIGNLTLLNLGVNRGLQNHRFKAKNEALIRESNLQLNRELMLKADWTEKDIEERGRTLFNIAVKLWPGPRRP